MNRVKQLVNYKLFVSGKSNNQQTKYKSEILRSACKQKNSDKKMLVSVVI